MKVKVTSCSKCPLFAEDEYAWCQHPDGPGTGVDVRDENENGVHAWCPLLNESLHILLEYDVKTFDGYDVKRSKTYVKWLEKHPEMTHTSTITFTENTKISDENR